MFWYKCAEIQFIEEFETLIVLSTAVVIWVKIESKQLYLHHTWQIFELALSNCSTFYFITMRVPVNLFVHIFIIKT